MRVALTIIEQIARARTDLRMGVPVILSAEPAQFLLVPIETLSQARLDQMIASKHHLHMVLTKQRAETLKIAAYDGDLARLALPADRNLAWLRSLANPVDDLSVPLKGPFHTLRGGEVQLDRIALALVKSAHLLPAALMASLPGSISGPDFAMLTRLNAEQAKPFLEAQSVLSSVAAAHIPTAPAANTRLHVFRPHDGGEEHYGLEIGLLDRAQPVLVRLHSACFTGDVLGSLKCDCGPQLQGALQQMGQEGRGIGLTNKLRAYALQDQGFDTVEANHRLGFEDDERDFRLGASILRKLGISQIRLLTNNPAKVAMMEQQGITVVERVPLKRGENPFNASYLSTKAHKSGHFL
jgi:GTP cyclohydrolase II